MVLTPNLRGALWMLASAAGFTAMTTLIKFLGADYPAALQTFYRQAAGLLVLLPLIARDWRGSFATTRPGILLFRSAVGTAAMIMGFYAYQELPLADANALSFTRTLWLAPLAAFVLKETVGPLRIAAAVAGFGGVLIMLDVFGAAPAAAFSLAHAAALGSALLFALTITGMKVMTRDHRAFVLLAWAAALGFVFSVPGGIMTWRWPTPGDLALLSLMGVLGVATQAAYIQGMQVGDAAAMAPVDYTRLVFAAALGFWLFGEVPSVQVMTGAAVVVVSALFLTWREHLAARRAARAASPFEQAVD